MAEKMDDLILGIFGRARVPLDTSEVHTLLEDAVGKELRLCLTFDRIREMADKGILRVACHEGHTTFYEPALQQAPPT